MVVICGVSGGLSHAWWSTGWFIVLLAMCGGCALGVEFSRRSTPWFHRCLGLNPTITKRNLLVFWHYDKSNHHVGSVCFAVKYFPDNVFRFVSVCFVVKC